MRLWQRGPEASFAELLDRLNLDLKPQDGRDALMAGLRVLKRQAALVIAIADIAGLWPVEKVTGALSAFAEGALSLVARHLLADAACRGEIELQDGADPARGSGFIVLGIGKLGAGELNYSSDIDLILLFDAEKTRYRGPRDLQFFYTRLAHELVRMMEERTADGYVFRTDLRLRPDPGSTPPALSFQAAIVYYESAGQNWERAALIKARGRGRRPRRAALSSPRSAPSCGASISTSPPFRTSIRSSARSTRIKGGATIAVAGHNIKLGRGGIREIEFFAQTQQLIWGGRQPQLRITGTCAALAMLAKAGHITIEAAETMIAGATAFCAASSTGCRWSRTRRPRPCPTDAERACGASRCSWAMRAPRCSPPICTRVLERRSKAITPSCSRKRRRWRRPAIWSSPAARTIPRPLETLARLGFAEPSADRRDHPRLASRPLPRDAQPAGARAVDRAGAGAARGLRRIANPDTALLRFDQFLSRLPAGVQLFSLLLSESRADRPGRRDHGRGAASGRRAGAPARPARSGADGRFLRGRCRPRDRWRPILRAIARPRPALRGDARSRAALGRRAQIPGGRADAAPPPRRRGGRRRLRRYRRDRDRRSCCRGRGRIRARPRRGAAAARARCWASASSAAAR